MRGQIETQAFRQRMLEVLNNDKNKHKAHWSTMSCGALKDKLGEEVLEVIEEMQDVSEEEGSAALADELVDLANVCMMLWERCVNSEDIKIGGTCCDS